MKKSIVALLLVAVFSLTGYRWLETPVPQEGTLTLYGNVDIREVALGFRVAGRIHQLQVEEGDKVNPGDLLATLDAQPFEQTLALRKAELAQTEATLGQVEKRYTRQAKLIKTGSAPLSDYDDALAERDGARGQIGVARARIGLAQTDLDDTKLIAPSPGIVLTRVRERGAIVGSGDTVYTLALESPVWVRAYVSEPELGKVYEGQPAIIKTDSGGRYAATIGFISPQAEFTPKQVETTQLRTELVYRLRVIATHPDHGLRQGMPVTVVLQTAVAKP